MAKTYFTEKYQIDIKLKKNKVVLMHLELQKVFVLRANEFIELLKNGGKGVRVPNKKVGFTKISFNKSNYHLGGEINTYLKSDVYQAIMSYVDNNK
jgi:hypothetical protein